jgi:putative (di)nucleoside polyphosphate hydrolase
MITGEQMPDSHFRAGVGIVVVDHKGRVLALERHDKPGAWQLPQGGIDNDERPDQAAWRELREETGLTDKDVRLICRHPGWLGYELPAEDRDDRLGRGQVHKWYVMALTGATAPGVELSRDDPDKGQPEFRAHRWMPFDELLSVAADFRVPVYREVAELSTSCGVLAADPSDARGREPHTGWWSRWTRRPSRTAVERLDSTLARYSQELEFKLRRTTGSPPWIKPVSDALADARSARAEGRIEEAWGALKTAARLDLFGADRSELLARAASLRNEAASKLSGWRGQSVAALLELDTPLDRLGDADPPVNNPTPQAGGDEETKWRVYQATALRDEDGDNTYYKVALAREQRTLLLGVLAAVITLLLVLVVVGWLSFDENPATPSAGLLGGVALFGMLGACLSAIRSMGRIPSGRIPEHTLASKLTVARPFIGAAAALGAFAIVTADFLKIDAGEEATVVLAVAFAAGFSDRLVMGIVESVNGA